MAVLVLVPLVALASAVLFWGAGGEAMLEGAKPSSAATDDDLVDGDTFMQGLPYEVRRVGVLAGRRRRRRRARAPHPHQHQHQHSNGQRGAARCRARHGTSHPIMRRTPSHAHPTLRPPHPTRSPTGRMISPCLSATVRPTLAPVGARCRGPTRPARGGATLPSTSATSRWVVGRGGGVVGWWVGDGWWSEHSTRPVAAATTAAPPFQLAPTLRPHCESTKFRHIVPRQLSRQPSRQPPHLPSPPRRSWRCHTPIASSSTRRASSTAARSTAAACRWATLAALTRTLQLCFLHHSRATPRHAAPRRATPRHAALLESSPCHSHVNTAHHHRRHDIGELRCVPPHSGRRGCGGLVRS